MRREFIGRFWADVCHDLTLFSREFSGPLENRQEGARARKAGKIIQKRDNEDLDKDGYGGGKRKWLDF